MRNIDVGVVTAVVRDAFLEIGVRMDAEVLAAMQAARDVEKSQTARFVLDVMTQNAQIAEAEGCPLCQDTGIAVVFAEIGQDVHFVGGGFCDAINQGVRDAYRIGSFRKSVLSPLSRQNTGDNTPAVIHTTLVEGTSVRLFVMCKGFGSENMSRLFMLPPSDGIEGAKDAIVRAALDAKSNPCPPVIVGVGIGGTAELAMLLSKKALFRSINSVNREPKLAEIEQECKERINAEGVGANGFGGGLTALAVLIESHPTHLAGLPVGVTIQCHASRHKEVVI